MSTPVSKVVNVTIQTQPTFPKGNGFGLLLVVGNSASLPSGDRFRLYNNMTDVAVDFGTTTEEYKAAQVFFSQNPSPSQLAIGRRFDVAIPGELLGSLSVDKNIATYTAINNGSLSLTVDGAAENLTGMDFTACASLNAVAAIVQTALAALKAGSTVVYSGGRFIVRSGTTGVNSAVGLSTAAGTGHDMGTTMGLTAASGAKTTAGSAVETIASTLDSLQNVNGSWYGVTFTKEVTVQNIKDAAAWTETKVKLFGYTSSDATILDPTSTVDLAAYLLSMNYSRTMGQWDVDDPYAIIAAFAVLFNVNYVGINTTITLKFKQESSVTAQPLTETQRITLVAKCINYYTTFGTSAMLAEGVVANGRFVDEVVGLDWLQNTIETNVFGYLFTNGKVPQTDKGVARLVQQVELACQQAVANGLLAPGYWTGQDMGTVSSGDFLPKGFYVYAQSVRLQSQTNREARLSPPIYVLAKGAGAIHHCDITVMFQR